MSSEITGKLLAGRLFITVIDFLIFELTLSPVFDFNESNSENVTFELCELEAALLDGETEEDRLRGVGTDSCEHKCFVVQSVTKIMVKIAIWTIFCFSPLPPLKNVE